MDLGRELVVVGHGFPYPTTATTYHPYATTPPLSTTTTTTLAATPSIYENGILLGGGGGGGVGTYGVTSLSPSPYRRIAPAMRSPAAAAFHNPVNLPNILNPVEPTLRTQSPPAPPPPPPPLERYIPPRERYQCNLPGCRKRAFARLSDLQRHAWSHHEVETLAASKATWRCDYRRCGRSVTPFHRLDHYRDHLRDQHREDLPRRRSKPDELWWSQRNPHCVVEGWWRCNKCLVVRVNTEMHGYVCPGCGSPIDAQRRTFREALLALPQGEQQQQQQMDRGGDMEGACVEAGSKLHSDLELLD